MNKTGIHNESELLERLRAGDHAAFGQLYATYSKQIYWKLLKMFKQEAEADELLQELFVKVWERREQVDPAQPFPAYLYRIAQRMAVDHYRKVARIGKAYEALRKGNTELVATTEEDLESKETRRLIDEAVAFLPKQRRQAFVLCKLEGKSHQEAAEIMHISPNTVHNHLVKAMRSIKAHLDRSHGSSLAFVGLLVDFIS